MTSSDDPEPVMLQGKWLDEDQEGSAVLIVDENGWSLLSGELVKQIRENPDAASGTLIGKPIVMEDEVVIANSPQDFQPGACHGHGTSVAGIRLPDPATQQCPLTQATINLYGLTRRGACPPIRNPRKAKKP